MGQSLVKNYIHIIFSTKGRKPLILPPFETQLYSYLGGICKKHDCTPIIIGGYIDHVHVLCLLSKKVTIVHLLEDLKSSSSKWMKSQDDTLKEFYWQDGYGAFSVNPSQVNVAVEYISNQQDHHRKKTFQGEYRSFLKKYKVEYDERYVWD
ncbi:transposase [Cognataquiflexum rubidum]|uniref:transposase n=1 Tax=Cognataquiflexum rubidum TaxID=2922273 RepID=UPI001F13FAC2|nr:transposase [Cognataquiflexum rubidum]MCH6235706.1 transposase [Cognataquiflexum rubidum]